MSTPKNLESHKDNQGSNVWRHARYCRSPIHFCTLFCGPKASILRGIDEPTVNAYEDMYAAEAENATSTSRSNATSIENNTGFQ
jgi:hypothetical protein